MDSVRTVSSMYDALVMRGSGLQCPRALTAGNAVGGWRGGPLAGRRLVVVAGAVPPSTSGIPVAGKCRCAAVNRVLETVDGPGTARIDRCRNEGTPSCHDQS